METITRLSIILLAVGAIILSQRVHTLEAAVKELQRVEATK